MTLKDTVALMSSENYKDRFIAEYWQTKIRHERLSKMIVKAEAGTLGFKLDTPLYVLSAQCSYMRQYLRQLEIRAEIENICLEV